VQYVLILGVINNFDVVRPSNLAAIGDIAKAGLLDLGVLQHHCGVVASNDFAGFYIMAQCVPVMVFAVFAFDYIASLVLAPMLTNIFSTPIDPHRRSPGAYMMRKLQNAPMDRSKLHNVFFSLMNTFFIGLVNLSVSLLQCYPNPNGSSSLTSAPYVLCNEGVWVEMLPLAIISFLVYTLAFFAYLAMINYISPKKFHDPVFRVKWLFLLEKFRPECWWWDQIVLFKSLLINFTTMFYVSGSAQVYWCVSILVCYTAGIFWFLPWRHWLVSFMDIVESFSLVAILMLMTWFVDKDRWYSELTDWWNGWIAVCSVVPFLLAGAVIMKFAYGFINNRQLLVADLKRGQYLRGTMQVVLQTDANEWHRFLMRLTDHDMDVLDRANSIILAELFQMQPSSKIWEQRLIISANKYLVSPSRTPKPVSMISHSFPGHTVNIGAKLDNLRVKLQGSNGERNQQQLANACRANFQWSSDILTEADFTSGYTKLEGEDKTKESKELYDYLDVQGQGKVTLHQFLALMDVFVVRSQEIEIENPLRPEAVMAQNETPSPQQDHIARAKSAEALGSSAQKHSDTGEQPTTSQEGKDTESRAAIAEAEVQRLNELLDDVKQKALDTALLSKSIRSLVAS